MWFLVYRNIDIGGAESLIIRLANALKSDALLGGIVADRISEYNMNNLVSYGLVQYILNYSSFKPVVTKISKNDVILTFNVSDFATCQYIARTNRSEGRIYMYMVHTLATSFYTNKWLKSIDERINRQIMRDYIANGNIFVMNESGKKSLNEAYGVLVKDTNMLCLPIETVKIDNADIENRPARFDKFHILTVARSEFPFKGYIKRLIAAVGELAANYKIKLTIITSSDDLGSINEWLSEAKIEADIYTDIKYDDLAEHYKKAHVYVGMGTTILEASMYGVPSFATESYTYDCNVEGLFTDDPLNVGTIRMNGSDVKPHLESILLLSDEDYKELCIKSNEMVCKYYDIRLFIEKVQYHELLDNMLHSWRGYMWEDTVRRIRHRDR